MGLAQRGDRGAFRTLVLASEAAQRTYGLRIPGTEIAPSRGSAHRCACLRALARYPE